MRVGRRVSGPEESPMMSHKMRAEHRVEHKAASKSRAKVYLAHLEALPAVTINDLKIRTQDLSDSETTAYKALVDEYSSVGRLDEVMSLAKKLSWGAATSSSNEEIIKLSEKLVSDRTCRLWFITEKNPAVKKSYAFWNASPFRSSVAKHAPYLVGYKRALKKIDQYERVCRPIREFAEIARGYY